MSQKVTDKQRRARIQPLLDYWTELMGIRGNWLLSWQLTSNLSDDGGVIARTYTASPYHKAFIRFDRKVIDSITQAELENTVVHELTHVITEELHSAIARYFGTNSFLYTEMTNPIEAVCDHLAAILVSMRYGKTRITYDQKVPIG